MAPAGSQLPATVSLASLSDYPVILSSEPNAIRRLLERQLRPRGVTLEVRAEGGAAQTTLALVAHGVGCTIVSFSSLQLGTSSLVHAPLGPPAIWNRLVLATPAAKSTTRVIGGARLLLRQLNFTDSSH